MRASQLMQEKYHEVRWMRMLSPYCLAPRRIVVMIIRIISLRPKVPKGLDKEGSTLTQ
jgi:hypothetical protein